MNKSTLSALSLILAPASLLAASPVDFAHRIAPILKTHCGDCHMGEKKKGGLSLNTAADLQAGSENGKVIDPANLAKSKMLEVLFSQDSDTTMPPPPKDPSKAMPSEAREALKQWILTGAPWESGFSFARPAYEAPIKPRKPSLPQVVAGRTNPIDRIIDEHLRKQGIPQPEPSDDPSFLRRAHLDLIGTLPSPQEQTKFLDDKNPEKYVTLIRSLLSRNSDYADHWMTFWNDLLRNDYGGTGFITGGRKQISAWLYRCLLENTPYDQMVRELVNPSPDTEGYAMGITWRGTVSASQTREVQYAQSVSQSFLGINMKCASCHDSFIDRWKLTDAYGLAAIYGEKPIEVARCEKGTGKNAVASWPFPEIGQIDPATPRDQRLKRFAELMTHPDNGWVPRTIVNRLWANLFGHGIVHPVDAMGTKPWNEDLLDYLGWHHANAGYNLKASLELIATSQAYRAKLVTLSREESERPFTFRGPLPKRFTAEQFVDALWQVTASAPEGVDAPVRRWDDTSAPVTLPAIPNRGLAAADTPADPKSKPAPALRLAFELREKPRRFAGIVTAPPRSRIALNGTLLAPNELQELSNGSLLEIQTVGHLKKGANEILILLPTSPSPTPVQPMIAAIHVSGETQWLSAESPWQTTTHVPPQALDKNKIKGDSTEWKNLIWNDAGRSEIQPTQSPLIAELSRAVAPRKPARSSLRKADLLTRALGRPNRDQIVTSRPQDLSTLEALDLSAGQRLAEMLTAGASKLASHWSNQPDAFVDWLFPAMLTRPASAKERAALLETLGQKLSPQSIEDVLWTILNLPEFQRIQ
jgi:hypothetical protein